MTRTTSIIEGVFAYFTTPILTKIGREPTRESLVKIHCLISGNVPCVASNLGGGQHRHLALTITTKDYMAHMGYVFVPSHNPISYHPMMVTAQEQALRTERFKKNQYLFIRCTAVGVAIKKHIVTEMQPVLLSPMVDQLTGFVQMKSFQINQRLFNYYRVIDRINIREKRSEDYGDIRPHGTSFLNHWAPRKGVRVWKSRRVDNFRHYDGLKKFHPFGTYSHIQWINLGVKMKIHQAQYMGRFEDLFPLNIQRTDVRGHHRRKGGLHSVSTEYPRCTATPTRRSPWGDWVFKQNIPRNENTEL